MPMISSFYGIIIKMYFKQYEHNPPHIHAIYGEYICAINIKTSTIMDGYIPEKALYLVKEWIKLHRDELLDIWNTQKFNKLPPLE